jgi:spore germination protein YaaH
LRHRIALFVASLFIFASASQAAFRNSVWIAPWIADALPAIQKNAGAMQESNPVWYVWNADGSIAKVWNSENPTWRAAMTGTELLPTIQNVVSGSFDGATAAKVLGNATSRDAHVNAIVSLVATNAFDGIDVDYERVPAASRADFTAFVSSLASKLHAQGKKLSITVYAKTSDSQNWNGPGAEDWSAIGGLADTVKIMAYDYHWETSDAGAITPLSWLDQVAAFAESAIPAQKIIVGLPWYGYDWPSSGTAATVSYAAAMQHAQSSNAPIAHDAGSGEATYTYGGRTVFFQDAQSYSAKLNMLQQKHGGIGGVAHWVAGDEDPAVWDVMRGTVSGGSPATPPPADFAISGPSSLTLQQGSSASATFGVTPINGFNGTVNPSATVLDAGYGITAIISPSLALTVTASKSTPAGVYQISVKATSGSITHQQIVIANVTAAPQAGGKRRATKH